MSSASTIPDHYAVFGNPIAHSRSPTIHRLFAEQTGECLDYTRQEVMLDGFADAVQGFFADGPSGRNKGLNVTVPFKEQAHALCDWLDEAARLAGAVNTLTLDARGLLCGYNTDGSGLLRDLEQNLGATLADARILLVGAGGAARGAVHPLLDRRPQLLTITNRSLKRAEHLAELVRQTHSERPLDVRPFAACAGGNYDLVINATSAGLGNDRPALPDGVFSNTNALAYDMVYGAEATGFERWALASGAQRTSNGLGMLVEQAADAFLIWRGKRPATAAVISVLRATIGH